MGKYEGQIDQFILKKSYKGPKGILDHVEKERGYFDKDTSNGSLWGGSAMKPLQRYHFYYQVLSTDYENYAIVY